MLPLEVELLKTLIRGTKILDDVINLRMNAAYKVQQGLGSNHNELLKKNSIKVAYYKQLKESYQKRISEIEDKEIIKKVAY